MMRRTILSVAALVMLVALAPSAQAVGPPGPDPGADYWMYEPEVPIEVGVGETFTLGHGWGSCRPGGVVAVMRASVFEWYVDGEPYEADGAWSRLYEVLVPPEWGFDPCLAGPSAQDPDYVWASDYVTPFRFDAPGDYEVQMVWTITHPVVDVGWAYEPQGRWDHYPAGLIDDPTVIVHVSG